MDERRDSVTMEGAEVGACGVDTCVCYMVNVYYAKSANRIKRKKGPFCVETSDVPVYRKCAPQLTLHK